MLKYVNTAIVFQEVPDEVSLAINISSCPCRCPGCHSKYLWEDTGTPLTPSELDTLISRYEGDITCIAFMGGDSDPAEVSQLAQHLHQHHPQLKVAWYSGRARFSPLIDQSLFHYIKLGPYLRHLGPLSKPTTNPRLYRRTEAGEWEDITSRFWNK